MEEIEKVNTKAGNAVLHYRTSTDFKPVGTQQAVSSANSLWNEAGENAVDGVKRDPHAEIWQLNLKAGKTSYRGAAARIPATGWLLITVDADTGSVR